MSARLLTLGLSVCDFSCAASYTFEPELLSEFDLDMPMPSAPDAAFSSSSSAAAMGPAQPAAAAGDLKTPLIPKTTKSTGYGLLDE